LYKKQGNPFFFKVHLNLPLHILNNKGLDENPMAKIGLQIAGKWYELKKQYPMVKDFGKKMDTVKKELNQTREKK
jgi:hypothetical protein